MKNIEPMSIAYILLIKLKLIVVVVFGAIIAGICYRFNIDPEIAHKWFRDHLEYLTCGSVGVTTAVATQTQTDYTNLWDFLIQKFIGLVFLVGSVVITFFLTKKLKDMYPEAKSNQYPDSQGPTL